MNEQQQKVPFLKIAAALALIAFSYAVIVFVHAYSKSAEPANFRSFSVSAEGKVTAIPDVANITLTVLSEGGTDLSKLKADNAQKNDAINTFLKDKGVESKDIKTLEYAISPRYEQCFAYQTGGVCPPPKIVGYTIQQSTDVKIRNFDTIGDILGGVVDKGANSVSQLQFNVDDATTLETQARAEAIAKAKEKASELAKTTHFKIGRLLGITEGASYPFQKTSAFDERSSLGMTSSVSPTIEAGSQEITITVTLTYEIQ